MATSQSVTFGAEVNKVWGTVVKVVNAAGYAVAETNAAAKQIKYHTSAGGFAWAQIVTVSVTGVEDNETMVTVNAEAAGQRTLTEGGQQRKLIQFVIDKLAEKFPMTTNQTQPSGAPGTTGCFGMILLLAVGGLSFCAAATVLFGG